MSRLRPSFLLFILAACFMLFSMACRKHYSPKPRGYFRIDFPPKAYLSYRSSCPFAFDYPKYATVQPDQSSFSEPCWLNVEFPAFHAKIHLSYKKIAGNLPELTEDARTFVYKHTIKADAIDEIPFANPARKVYGIFYDIRGNAASSVQFFLTDSTHHFVRGALYFSVTPNADSLAPVIRFIREDIVYLTNSFQWLNE